MQLTHLPWTKTLKVCAKQRTDEDYHWWLNNHAVCVKEYFYDSAKSPCQHDSSKDPIYEGYKAVLDSKTTDETLVTQWLFPTMWNMSEIND